MISRTSLQERAREWGLSEEVVEKDYVLGWLLWGIGRHPALRDSWVFKGGTCLKKCFIETYRFSEDLDFTVRPGGPLEPEALLPILEELLGAVEEESGLSLTRRAPVIRMRPDGRSAEGRIYYAGPRGAPAEARVKLDLTYDEILVETPVRRPISHAYDDVLPGDADVVCYSFVEVFAEKLRALGQRARPRDLYDVVNLHRRVDFEADRDAVVATLTEKCHYKEVGLPDFASVTDGSRGDELRADWTAMLAHQLPALPPLDDFIDALGGVFEWLNGHDVAGLQAFPQMGEPVEPTWAAPATITRWPGGVPLEQIRFAGSNHLLVELVYDGSIRLIEPYALRRSRAGNFLVYAIRADNGQVRAYRVDRIQGVRVTDRSFTPRYAIELAVAQPVASSRGRRGAGSRRGRRRL
ncbi:MAG: nucleotidyl transferase AbiEii/AbiGii toxin family protein [Thermoleophilia bacterium]